MKFWFSRLLGFCLAVMPFMTFAQTSTVAPELVVQTGHADTIKTIAFNPRFNLLVSGGTDRILKLWDVANERELRTFAGHTDAITGVVFSPNGAVIASSAAYEDSKIILWSVEDGSVLGAIETDLHNPLSIAFHPDNKRLISGGEDKTVRLWSLENGKEILALNGHLAGVNSVAVNAKGSYIASGSADKTIKIWDGATGKLLQTLRGHTAAVNSVTFSVEGGVLFSGGSDGTVRVWNLTTGQQVVSLPGESNVPVASVALSPDGKYLAAGRDAALSETALSGKLPSADEDGEMPTTVDLWDLETGRAVDSFDGGSESGTGAVAFSPDGAFLVGASDKEINGWELAKLDTGGFYLGGEATGAVNALAVSSDGKMLAWGGNENYISIWNLTNGQELRTLDKFLPTRAKDEQFAGSFFGVQALAFSANNKFIASGGLDNTVRIWNAESGNELRRMKGHTNFVNAVSFSADGKILASCGGDNTVRIWNAETGTLIKTIPTGKDSFAASVAASSDGKIVAFGDLVTGSIKIYNIAIGRVVRTIKAHDSGVLSLAFTPEGKILSYGKDAERTDEMRLFDVSTGAQSMPDPNNFYKSRMSGHTAFVRAGNRNLQFVRQDARIRLGDLETGNDLLTLVAFGKHYNPAFNSTSKILRQFQTGRAAERDYQIDWLVATPDGFFDGTNEALKQTLWRFNNNTFELSPTEAFFNEFYHPGLFADVLRGKPPVAPRDFAALDRRQPIVVIKEPGSAKNTPGTRTTRVQQIQVEIEEAAPDAAKKLGAGEIRDVRLFRNGSLVRLWRGNSVEELVRSGCQRTGAAKGAGRKILCTADVKITSGGNEFTAYAFNRDNVRSATAEETVEGALSLKRDGTLYVLAIGVNKYKNSEKDLSFAVADVDSIASGLSAQQSKLSGDGYAKTQVVKLLDSDAKRANILAALKRFSIDGDKNTLPPDLSASALSELSKIKPAEPEDALVIYFAGHGTARCEKTASGQTNCDRFYLIPHDGFPTGEMEDAAWLAAIYRNSVSDEDLETALETVDAGKLLFVIDACESGQALEAEEKRRGPMNSRGLAQLAYEKGMYVLTAAQSQQAALEISKLGHGLLTFALIEAFQKGDKNNDKFVFEREWMDYAVRQVPTLQFEAMKQRNAENRGAGNKKKKEITVVPGDDPNAEPEKRNLQTPRVFYRREDSTSPFIVAKP